MKNITSKPEVAFDELGMVQISDQALLELIAGGMATQESMQETGLADNCTNTGQCTNSQCTGH